MKCAILIKQQRWAIVAALAIATAQGPAALFAQSPERNPQEPDSQVETTSEAMVSEGAAERRERAENQIEHFLRQAIAAGSHKVQLAELAQERASAASIKDFAVVLERDHRETNQRLRSLANHEGITLPDEAELANDGEWSPEDTQYSPRVNQPYTGLDPNAHPGMRTTPHTPGPEDDIPAGEPDAPGTTATLPGQTERDQLPRTQSPEQPPLPPEGAIGQSQENQSQETGRAIRSPWLDELMGLRGQAFDQRFLDIQIESHRRSVELYEQMANRPHDSDVRRFARSTLPLLIEHLNAAVSLRAQRPRSDGQE